MTDDAKHDALATTEPAPAEPAAIDPFATSSARKRARLAAEGQPVPTAKPELSAMQRAIAEARKECGCLACVGRQRPMQGGFQRSLNGGNPMGCVAAAVLAHLLGQLSKEAT